MQSNKQILWIVTELFPPDESSTSYIMGQIANAFVGKYQVKVICGPEIYDVRKKLDANNKFQLDSSIELFRTESVTLDKNTFMGKAMGFLLMTYKLLKLAKKHIRSEDKVLMVTNPAPLIVWMSRLKKKVGFELNILVHDIFPENTVPAGLKLPAYGWFKNIFDKAYSRADQLIVLGRDMQQVIQQKIGRFGSKAKVCIIENWGDVETVRPQAFSSSRIVLQYAGNIGRVQGLDKVINELPEEVELHIYGTGAMENSLKAMNHPNVFFHGPYFRSQQSEVLSACHLAIVTLQEGMYGLGVPSKTYNILAAGRPIMYLGPEGSEIDLLVREKHIGFIGWPKVWDVQMLEEMGAAARRLAQEAYSKEQILRKFVQAI